MGATRGPATTGGRTNRGPSRPRDRPCPRKGTQACPRANLGGVLLSGRRCPQKTCNGVTPAPEGPGGPEPQRQTGGCPGLGSGCSGVRPPFGRMTRSRIWTVGRAVGREPEAQPTAAAVRGMAGTTGLSHAPLRGGLGTTPLLTETRGQASLEGQPSPPSWPQASLGVAPPSHLHLGDLGLDSCP